MARLGLAAALLLAAILAPAPAAAEMDLAFEMEPGLIVPESEARAVTLVVTLDCEALLARTAVEGSATLTLAVEPPAGVLVTGPSTQEVSREACPEPLGTATIRVDQRVTITREAPGLSSLQIRADASLDPHPADTFSGGPRMATGQFVVVGAPYFLLQPAQAQKVVDVHDNEATVTLTLSNLGNIRTQVDLVAELSGGEMEPASVVLDTPNRPKADAATSKEVTLTFHAPSGPWSTETAQVVLTSRAADQPSSVSDDVLSANFLFRNANPVERATPPPVPALLMLTLALAAILARR